MGANFVHDGDAIDYTPSADVASGAVVVQENLVGVAKLDITANTLGALQVCGVFDFPKEVAGGSAIAAGVTLYWDEAGQVVTTSDLGGANKLIGKSIAAAGDDDMAVRVRLSQ